MGLTLRTGLLENMFLYFLSSETERRLVFTLPDIRETFTRRYGWPWDTKLTSALSLLITDRVSRRQPGLLKLPRTDFYTWQAGFDPTTGEALLYSSNFTAHTIASDCEAIRAARFHVNYQQILTDGMQAFTHIRGEDFSDALRREDAEQQARLAAIPEARLEDFPF